MLNAQMLEQFIIMIIPLIFAVTIHEFAHGYVAYLMGDDTARMAGRLTLNPIRHLDPFGSVILPIMLKVMGSGIMFGYAKPVPVNYLKLRDYRKGVILVAAAGVTANLICAAASGVLFKVMVFTQPMWHATFLKVSGEFLIQMLYYSVIINMVLLIFNLIPVPPLDGSKIMAMILPDELSLKYQQFERYGMMLIILLLFFGITGKIINFFLTPVHKLLLGI